MHNRFLIPLALLIFSLGSNAHALTIAGWSVKTKSLDALYLLQGLPNTSVKPTVGVWTVDLKQIEYLCFNPKNFNVAPGVAGQRTVTLAEPVEPCNEAGPCPAEGKGKGSLNFVYDYGNSFTCVNRNWVYIDKSAVAKEIKMTVDVYMCGGSSSDPQTACYIDGEPWIQGEKQDTLILQCSLPFIGRITSGEQIGQVVPGQVYDCHPIFE
jgi:hypothetical protein